MLHRNITQDDIHSPFNWIVADTAARTALVVEPEDVYKACWQIDTGFIYILTDDSPATWVAIGVNAGGPVAFQAVNNANQGPLSAGAFTKINLQVEDYDTHGTFSTATSLFTCSRAGLYHFEGRATVDAGWPANSSGLSFFKSGIEKVRGQQSNSVEYTISASCDLQLIVGDTVGLYSYAGVAYTLGTRYPNAFVTGFSGHEVR